MVDSTEQDEPGFNIVLISFLGKVSYFCYDERKGFDVILFQYCKRNARYPNP